MVIVTDFRAIGLLDIMRRSVVDGVYTINGAVTPVPFGDVMQDLIDMQTYTPKLLYGGVEYANLHIPVDMELKNITLLRALQQIKKIAIDPEHPLERPELVYHVEIDETDPTHWELWLRVPVDVTYGGSLGRNIGQELRIGSNISLIKRTVDWSEIYNRIFGYGASGLTLDSPGYVEDTESQGQYGVCEYPYTEEMATTVEELQMLCEFFLLSKKIPYTSYGVQAADAFSETANSFDYIPLYSLIRLVCDSPAISELVRVVEVRKRLDRRGEITYQLNSKVRDIAGYMLELWTALKGAGWGVTQTANRKQIEYWSDVADYEITAESPGFNASVVVSGLPSEVEPKRMTAVLKYNGADNQVAEFNSASSNCGVWVEGVKAIDIPQSCFGMPANTYNAGDALMGNIDIKSTFKGNDTYAVTAALEMQYGYPVILHGCQVGLKFNWE